MKSMCRGLVYGTTLVVLNYIIGEFASYNQHGFLGVFLFMVAGIYFLTSDKLEKLFLCGFTALFTMFAVQIQLLGTEIYTDNFFGIYCYGLIGTAIALGIAIVMTLVKLKNRGKRGKLIMDEYVFDKELKIKLLVYAIVTAIGFGYLVMPDNAGISVIVFGIIQAVMLFFIVPDKKRLWYYIPIFILTCNYFISHNSIWRVPNIFVCMALYSLMFVKIDIKDSTLGFVEEWGDRILAPLGRLTTPFKWIAEFKPGSNGRLKRIVIAAVSSLAAVTVLCIVLSRADLVFAHSVLDVITDIGSMFEKNALMKAAAGIIAGVYLFGVIHSAYEEYELAEAKEHRGDIIIIGAVMGSMLFVYTFFVIIQFRYLFAGAQLPYGLDVTEYARRGFFELLGLSGVNIVIILAVTRLTDYLKGVRLNIIKGLNVYLCLITMVLLVSSFYRMWLYNYADGLTRLRFMVFGFLIFEGIGLVITLFYIIKPRFNIVVVYTAIALCYYLVLNIVPMDKIIAKSQVDRLLAGERDEIEYVLTLSADAADEVLRAYNESDKIKVKHGAEDWINRRYWQTYDENEPWQEYNLSVARLRTVYEKVQ